MHQWEAFLFEDLKRTWHRLRHAQPGNRFQDYHRVHQARMRTHASRLLSIVVGIAVITVGIVALPAPGPGSLIIAIGATFVARESLVVARLLDWLEVRLRAMLTWARAAWRKASPAKRASVVLVGFGVLGLAVYFAYAVTLGA